MDAHDAAQRWADTWARAWPAGDAAAIAALYAEDAVHRSTFRPPRVGLAAMRWYLDEELAVEEDLACWFGAPVVTGDRAAVEWCACWREHGQDLTFAGVTVLRFDADGDVVEHRDYDGHVEGRHPPFDGW